MFVRRIDRSHLRVIGNLGRLKKHSAAALVLLSRLWDLGCSTADLAALAAQLGSDVPFFVRGGTALCGVGWCNIFRHIKDLSTDYLDFQRTILD